MFLKAFETSKNKKKRFVRTAAQKTETMMNENIKTCPSSSDSPFERHMTHYGSGPGLMSPRQQTPDSLRLAAQVFSLNATGKLTENQLSQLIPPA